MSVCVRMCMCRTEFIFIAKQISTNEMMKKATMTSSKKRTKSKKKSSSSSATTRSRSVVPLVYPMFRQHMQHMEDKSKRVGRDSYAYVNNPKTENDDNDSIEDIDSSDDDNSDNDSDSEEEEDVPLKVLQERLLQQQQLQKKERNKQVRSLKRKTSSTSTSSSTSSSSRRKKKSSSTTIQTQLWFVPASSLVNNSNETNNTARRLSSETSSSSATATTKQDASEQTKSPPKPKSRQSPVVISRPRGCVRRPIRDDRNVTKLSRNIISFLQHRTTIVPTSKTTIMNEKIKPNQQGPNSCMLPTQTTIGKSSIPWTNPKWVKLVNTSDNNNNSNQRSLAAATMFSSSQQHNKAKVTHMCWDSMGVLLTVATSHPKIQIYDWDMVRLADIHGKQQKQRRIQQKRTMHRNQHQQQQQEDATGERRGAPLPAACCFQIPPIMEFRIPYMVSCMTWKSLGSLDLLGIGFRHSSGKTHLYDVNAVSKWQQDVASGSAAARRNRRPASQTFSSSSSALQNHQNLYPPPSTYQLLQSPRSEPSVECILFLKDYQNGNNQTDGVMIVVSVGTMIYCYHQKYSDNHSYTLYWRCQFTSTVTSIVDVVNSNNNGWYLIIGTKLGHISVLDSYRRTRERAFSMEYRPVILLKEQRYIPSVYLEQKQNVKKQQDYWKIVTLQVDCHTTTKKKTTTASASSTGGDVNNEGVVVRCRIRWVTASGWVLSTWLQQVTQQRWVMVDGHILYEPPKVQYRNAETGSVVAVEKPTWSHTLSVTSGMIPFVGGNSPSHQRRQTSIWFPPIPRDTQTLAPHDKYVVASTTTAMAPTTTNPTAGTNDSATRFPHKPLNKQQDWYLQHNPTYDYEGKDLSPSSAAIESISMSMNVQNNTQNKRPHVVALHRDLEWMVLGVDNQLVIMKSSRSSNNNNTSNWQPRRKAEAVPVAPQPRN